LIARQIYGAAGVSYSETAVAKLREIAAMPDAAALGTCMVKTHLSLSHDPDLKGRPRGWTLPVLDILVYKGAGFVAPVAGPIKLMPGTGSQPAFRQIDIDVHTRRVTGLF
jgi:formate--tetrahydrofolate ligase